MLTYITDTESGGMFQSETVPPRASTAGQRGDGRRQNKGKTEQHSRRPFLPRRSGPHGTLCRPWPESVLVGQTLSKSVCAPPQDGGCTGRYKEKGGADKENEQDGGAQ